jgi:hypothetical protein
MKDKFNILYEEIMSKYIANEARELTFQNRPLQIANIWKQNLLDVLSDKFTDLDINVGFEDLRNVRDRIKVNHWLCFLLTFQIEQNVEGTIRIDIAPMQGNVYNNKEVRMEFSKTFYTDEHEFINKTVMEKRTFELSVERDHMTASEFPTPELITEILDIYQKNI